LKAENPAVASLELAGHDEFIIDVAISADSRWLLTGSSDKTARLWDLSAEDPSKSSVTLRGNDHAVQFVAFTPDSHWLMTASSRTVRVGNSKAND
jgi:WD40 repeat protein